MIVDIDDFDSSESHTAYSSARGLLGRPHTPRFRALIRRPAMTPHDADVLSTSCSVRPSAISSVTILYIGGNRRPSQRFKHVKNFRDCVLPQENTIVRS